MTRTKKISKSSDDDKLTRRERCLNGWTGPKRSKHELRFTGKYPDDPTEEEIQQRCLEIQGTWSKHAELHHRVTKPLEVVLHEAEFPRGLMV